MTQGFICSKAEKTGGHSFLGMFVRGSLKWGVLAGLTDSISKSDLLTSEISSTVVLNALDQLKKGKSDGSSLCSDAFIFAKDILSYR